MKKKKITIYDIAKKLGVSATTVSRALSDHHSIGKETKMAVRKLAREMGYRPNTLAAGLRKKKTNTIGVIVPWINRPFISSFISGIEEKASEAGYSILITQSYDSYQKEVNNANSLYANRVDGLIVSLAMETKRYEHLQIFQDNGIPLILADRTCDDLNVDKVVIDNFSAAFSATESLIRSGRQRIAHLAGAAHRDIYRQRMEGYQAALVKYELPVDPFLIISSMLDAQEGIKCIKKLLDMDRPPDAIFGANDTVTVHALIYARNAGYRIPEEIAFVGFNNDPIASIVTPQLTTIANPGARIGHIAAQRLLMRIANSDLKPETIKLPTNLIVRNSSAPEKDPFSR